MARELMLDVGLANELKLAFRKAGFSDGDVKRLCEDELLSQLLPVVRGQGGVTLSNHYIDCDANPLIPSRAWRVEEHRKGGQMLWTPSALGLYLSERQRSMPHPQGSELRKELATQPVLNANVLDHLLRHPYLIPSDWKKVFDIFFWGTIYRHDTEGGRYVRCLSIRGPSVGSTYYSLGHRWDADGPAAVLRTT